MERYEDNGVGDKRLKRRNSIGGENGTSSACNISVLSEKTSGRSTRESTKTWSSITLAELALKKNEMKEGRDNGNEKDGDLISKERERLQRLKLDVLRENEKRRKSWSFTPPRRKSSNARHFPEALADSSGPKAKNSDSKDAHISSAVTQAPTESNGRRRRMTLTLPVEQVKSDVLSMIQHHENFERELNRTRKDHESVAGMQICTRESENNTEIARESSTQADQSEHQPDERRINDERFRKTSFPRYGSPSPKMEKSSEGQQNEVSHGPTITVSNNFDLNIKVKSFLEKSQPKQGERSLRVARNAIKLASIKKTKGKTNKTIEEKRPSVVVNTETCPPLSFFGDRSWYYQDKRRKCRYLRVPDSPIPPISSVFKKD